MYTYTFTRICTMYMHDTKNHRIFWPPMNQKRNNDLKKEFLYYRIQKKQQGS